MVIFIVMDLVILAIFQNFSIRFERLTGKNCFWLAKWAYISCAIEIILACVVCIFVIGMPGSFVVLMLTPLSCFFAYRSVKRVEAGDKKALFDNSSTLNKLVFLWAPVRVRTLLILFVLGICQMLMQIQLPFIDLAGWSLVTHVLLMSAGIYFESCTPLPPAKSKVKEWLEALKKKLSLSGNAAPTPSPA